MSLALDQCIIDLCAEAAGVASGELDMDSRLDELPSWDSLAVLELLSALEDEHRIEFDPVALFECATPREMTTFVMGALDAHAR